MRISLSEIKNVQTINTQAIVGGKRYGIIRADSRAGRRALRRGGLVPVDTAEQNAAPEPGTVVHYINAQGEEICIEW